MGSYAMALLRPILPSLDTLAGLLGSAYNLPIASGDPGWKAFLETVLIAPLPGQQIGLTPDPASVSTMHKVITRAIEKMLHKNRFARHASNVLCLGFRPASEGSQAASSGLENFYPNTLIDQLASANWDHVLALYAQLCVCGAATKVPLPRVGDDCMVEVLEKCSIFVRLGNGSFLQVCGPAVSEMAASVQPSPNEGSRAPAKLLRHKIFYSSPLVSSRDNQLVHNLPRKHLLNCKLSHIDALTRKIFYNGADEDASFPDLRVLAAQVRKKHRQCPYKRIFDYYCAPVSPTPTEPGANVLSLCLPYYQVYSFLRRVLTLVLPKPLQGKEFMLSLCKKVRIFVRLRRFESMSLDELVKAIPLKRCQWLSSILGSFKSRESSRKAQRLLRSFVKWIFEDFLIPLVKIFFMVTDSVAHRNRIFYFRHDCWRQATVHFKQFLQTTMLGPWDPRTEPISADCLGIGSLRLVPKDDSFRPVMNLRRKATQETCARLGIPSKVSFKASINGTLKNLHEILNHCRMERPGLLGASLLGFDEVARKLEDFKRRLGSGGSGSLYFCKFDVKSCFDSVPQGKLLDVIVSKVLPPGDFTIHRFDALKQVLGKPQVRFRKYAGSSYDFEGLEAYVRDRSNLQCSVLVDRVIGSCVERRAVIKLLYEHIVGNLVAMDSKLFVQKSGIPQGSILSTLLCSFLYGDLDNVHLGRFLGDPNSLMMRFVDDLIYISFSSDTASAFVDVVSLGFPEYGFVVNQAKTLSNFPHPLVPEVVDTEETFPWCGLRINQRTLETRVDFGKFTGTHIGDSLSIERTCQPVQSFCRQLKMYDAPRGATCCHVWVPSFMKLKLSQAFLSPGINSRPTATRNVYENFVLAALKAHVYLRELRRDDVANVRGEVLNRCIGSAIRFACRLVAAHRQDIDVRSLGHLAFEQVFRSKPTAYLPTTLPYLRARCQGLKALDRHTVACLEACGDRLLKSVLY